MYLIMSSHTASQYQSKQPLNLIILIPTLHSRLPPPATVKSIHTNVITITTGRHPNRLSPCLRILEEFPEFLFADLDCLGGGSVGHAEHGAPEVEGVGNVCADSEEDEEDKVDGVSQD